MLNLSEYEYSDVMRILEHLTRSSINKVLVLDDDGEIVGVEIIPPDRYLLVCSLERIIEIIDHARARAIIAQFRDNHKEVPAPCSSESSPS